MPLLQQVDEQMKATYIDDDLDSDLLVVNKLVVLLAPFLGGIFT
jgi:hypothetical protein